MRNQSVLIGVLIACLLIEGCSIRQYAVDLMGDVMASGGSVYESDDDIVLIGNALPFSLKLIESLLATAPTHGGLLIAAARGFVLYTYAYVHYEAEQQALVDLEQSRAGRDRARRLYLRAFGYALRALDQAYPGAAAQLAEQPQAAAQRVGVKATDDDVALLYWSAAALGLAISVSKSEPAMLARLPEVDALLERALVLKEAWQAGALHEFKLTWAAARRLGGEQQAMRAHYERALALSQGRRASVYVAYAEAALIPTQDRDTFHALLQQALAIDPYADPEGRLLNLMAQRRARWLLAHLDNLFL